MPHVRLQRSRIVACRLRLRHNLAACLTPIVLLIGIAASRPAFLRAQAPPSASSLEQQISGALEQGGNAEAGRALNQLLSEPALDAGLLLRVGIAFAQKGLYAEAARAFAGCVRDHPALFEGHYNLALAELAQGRLPEALRTIDQAPHVSEEDSTARLYLRGKIEAAMGRTQAAQQDLSAAFEKDPASENRALDLGLLYLRVQAYPQAERVFARGAKLNPRSPYLLLGLALAQFLDGRTGPSMESSRRLLALAPEFSPARLLLGFTLYFEGDLEGARQVAREGLALPEPNPYLYYLDAVALLKRHESSDARILSDLAASEKAIPGCALCYVASGKAREEQSDLAGARSDFQTAVRLAPGLSEGWYHLALIDDRLGEKAEAAQARQHFQQMKLSEDERDKEMMRSVFLETLGAQEPAGSP